MSKAYENGTRDNAFRRRHALRGYARVLPAVCMVIAALLICCSCRGGGQSNGGAIQQELDFTPRPLTETGRRTPLAVTDREVTENGFTVRYPHICDDGMELLDIAVRSVCIEFARANAGNTGYKLRYNNRGILSFTMYAEDASGSVTAVSAANFNCDTGKQAYLTDFFGNGDTSYRFALSDSVTAKVTAAGHTVLSYLPPIDDSRLFYISESGPVLLYRMYEICGAEAGFPEVAFRFDEVERYLGPDALLLRMPYFDR